MNLTGKEMGRATNFFGKKNEKYHAPIKNAPALNKQNVPYQILNYHFSCFRFYPQS